MMAEPDNARRRLPRTVLIAFVATWIGAFVATHLPRGQAPSLPASDKTVHAIGYFVLGSLFLLTLKLHDVRRARRIALIPAALAVYAFVDEITQPLVHRHASGWDWLADVIGAVIAVGVGEAILACRARTRPARAPDD
jgi:VanZ family protein